MRLRSLLLSLVVLATACAGGTAADDSAVDNSDTTSAEAPADSDAAGADGPSDAADSVAEQGPQAPADVPEVLDFQATSVSGETVAGGDFAGQDLMLWFWAPW